MFSVHVSEKKFFWEKQLDDSESHRPLHHFNIKAETLVNGVGFPPNAGLEFEHLRLVQDETVLEMNTAYTFINLSPDGKLPKLYYTHTS